MLYTDYDTGKARIYDIYADYYFKDYLILDIILFNEIVIYVYIQFIYSFTRMIYKILLSYYK